MSRCVIYIASGKQYINEAMTSGKSVKKHNAGLPLVLCTDTGVNSEVLGLFDKVIAMPLRRGSEPWYLDCVLYLHKAVKELDYEQILLLDTDTYICDSLQEHYAILERFDIVGTHPPGRVTTQSVNDIPASFPEIHIGALAFRNNPAVRGLIDQWLYLYSQNRQLYGNNDQGPLRDALWINKDIAVYAMPPEFCFRFPFGGLLRGKCKVLHGRSNRPYSEIEQMVNSDWRKIRIFKRGFARL